MRFFKSKIGGEFDSYPVKVEFYKLTELSPVEQDKLLKQAGIWAKDAWQYDLPLFKNWNEYHWELSIRRVAEALYFAIYAYQPVGMFSLTDLVEYQCYPRPLKVKSLGSVYVDSRVRSLGIGRQILKKAELLAQKQHTDMIVLQTTKPSLNLFYKKQGYEYVCESHFDHQPLSSLSFKLK